MAEAVRALTLAELRKRKSVKWRHFPSDVLPLPVAEMDFPTAVSYTHLTLPTIYSV